MNTMQNIIQSIRKQYPVSEEALNELCASMQLKCYPKHTLIVRSGTVDPNVYFIEEGLTRSFFLHDGTETTTWFSREGDITFGMNSLYNNEPSMESVETLEACKLYVIPIEKLNQLYIKHIDIANWGRIIHQHGYSNLSYIFVDQLQLSPQKRYERFMTYFPGVINRIKLKYVASFLGITIYTLSRVRAVRN